MAPMSYVAVPQHTQKIKLRGLISHAGNVQTLLL
jgi:hypothetical protein